MMYDKEYIAFVKEVQRKRKEMNLTQVELAKKSNITQVRISQIENYQHVCSAATMLILAKVLGIKLDDL